MVLFVGPAVIYVRRLGLGLAQLKGLLSCGPNMCEGLMATEAGVDLFVVYSCTVGRNFISVLGEQREVVSTVNWCSELTLKQHHHRHGVRPEPDCTVHECPICNYNRFNWISMLTFSAVQISMLTFSTS